LSNLCCRLHHKLCVLQDNNETCSDYINANFVDGYKQPRAFIFSQGPLPKTFSDFWQMAWEQEPIFMKPDFGRKVFGLISILKLHMNKHNLR
jgi:hypothetical protein